MTPMNALNPLSPFTYYRRHKSQALLLLVLIGSLTLGSFVPVGATFTGTNNAIRQSYHLTRVSRILAGQGLDPGTVTQLRGHPDVAAVLPENGLTIDLPSWGFGGTSRLVLGVTSDNLELAMQTFDLRLKEGRLVEPQAAEIVLSEEIARALGLQIGDVIGHEIDEDHYATIMTELTLVGILESVPSTLNRPSPSETEPQAQLGLVSYEYLEGHEAYQPRLSNLLLIPQPGRRVSMNDFATALIDGSGAAASVSLETFEHASETMRQLSKVLYGMHFVGGGVLAVSIALVVGMINRIAIAQRLPELGLLHAAGFEKRRLMRRFVFEIAAIAGIGWTSGLLLSITLIALLNAMPSAAAEPHIDLSLPFPFLITLAAPLAAVVGVTISVRGVLKRLDAVAIVERGKLGMEGAGDRRRGRSTRSSRNPLSSWTFHLRHGRRSLALFASTGLMVLGVAFPAFISTFMLDSLWPFALGNTSHAGAVYPASTYQAVDPTVLAQIKTHPAVDRLIPVKTLQMAVNVVPFEFPMTIHGVREGDMQAVLDAYDLYVGEGRLPQPQSGEIVLTRALARNRGLSIGDAMGRSIHELDSMPTELTVVGLLDSSTPEFAAREGIRIPHMPRWAAFVPYEFVEHHEQYSAAPMGALVLAIEGSETEVETWLEEHIDSSRVMVATFGAAYHGFREANRSAMGFLAMIESIVTVVLAGALAILSYIHVTQRRDEFGVLHAAGYSRAALVARTVQESVGISVAAWLIGAACSLVLLLSTQTLIYVPRGMSLDLYNPWPWLFTLPIPLATIAASAGTIWWALSRLDPVAVIERR